MSNSIFTIIKKFYDEWNIQGFILFSLSLQAILIMFAPFRKRIGSGIVILLIWLAYLLADWAASFAVGLISNSQKYSQKIPDDHADILAFWAPFLLLHLGGPDTITAFALEDNTLWRRHLLGLLSQVVAAIIVFGQSFPRNKLWVPTVFLFVTGTIKYGERTCALFLANLDKFREFMLKEHIPRSNYTKLIERDSLRIEAQLPILIELIPEPFQESNTRANAAGEGMLKDLDAVKYAYLLFKIFNGLIVDLIFSFRDHDDSRLFFRQTCAEDAIKVLAVQLNFIYELLYTKVVVVHSRFGYFVRFISWCAVVAALSIFYSLDKHGFCKIDVVITYSLLFGAIGLETIALFMLAFSDWTAASIQQLSRDNICIAVIKSCFLFLLKYFLSLKRINWHTDPKSISCLERARQILFRRWSESLHQYNLIDYCFKESSKKNLSHFDYFGRILIYVIEELRLKDFYDWMKYVSKKPLTKELWGFIFEELKKKSTLADDPETAKKICSARGDWVLKKTNWKNESSKLMHYILDVEFDESLILWHIATDLCYRKKINEDKDSNREVCNSNREFCKILSDYMLYLLVMQPTMMSAVTGISLKRFHDTCTEAKKLFHKNIDQGQKQQVDTGLLEKNVAPSKDISRSVLFDACILAKELGKLEGQTRWKLISEVWVELLSYAASHCRANTHAAQLSKGGELVTFVWLLMAHFGIGDQYQITKE